MKLTIRQAIAIHNVIAQIETPASVPFNYAMAINRRKLRVILDAAKEASKMPADVAAFERLRKTVTGAEGREALLKEHPDIMEKIKAYQDSIEANLDREEELDLRIIPLADVPPGLPTRIFDVIFPLIEAG